MSKRKWHHPEVPSADLGTKSWRSLGELEDTPAFQNTLEREFPSSAAMMADEEDGEQSRRSFMKLMGASSALAGMGLVSCRRPEKYILPYAQAPEWVIPGKPTYYATSMPCPSGSVPLVVTTHEERPTKLEPNKSHPSSSGTDAFVQASILNLYSPERSKSFLSGGKKSDRSAFQAALNQIATNTGASKVGFLVGEDVSPTRSRLLNELKQRYAGSRFYSYEALEGDVKKQVEKTAYGDGVKAIANFERADRVLSLDADFLGLDNKGPVNGFYARRHVEGKDYDQKPDASKLNRLYSVEGTYSLTGGMADHRLRIAPSQIVKVAATIAKALGINVGSLPTLTDASELKWVKECAADLKASGARSLVLAGSRQSKTVQQLAIAINNILGVYGSTINLQRTEKLALGSVADLAADIEAGKIDTLISLTPADIVYDAPADLDLGKKLSKLKTLLHLGERANATAQVATLHAPGTHYLEQWGDSRSANGAYGLVQPMVLPLFGGISDLELLSALLGDGTLVTGEDSAGYKAVRETFSMLGGSESAWDKTLRKGFNGDLKLRSTSTVNVKLDVSSTPIAPANGAYELVFSADASVWDGRFIDNGWLQEAPDPIHKLTWDNAAFVSPKTAKDMGIYDVIVALETGRASVPVDGEGEHRKAPFIKVSVNGKVLELPVLIAFGQADNVVSIPLGYGQGYNKSIKRELIDYDSASLLALGDNAVGQVGVNAGFNAYPLRSSTNEYFVSGAKVEKIKGLYRMALTQEHHAMYGRALAREISTIPDSKGKDFNAQLDNVVKQGMDSHAPENISLYLPKGSENFHDKLKANELIYDKVHQWGMSLDTNTCTGCNACLVACQAENNIPIVGKEQVAKGREMHWIRMDRYFAAKPVLAENGKLKKDDHGHYVYDDSNPEMIPQPVACQQCESAPCETVCPVNATVHTEDGLNAMAYNRCIGTRYCANNCPYKARRFNFFDYNKRNPLLDRNLYKGPFGEKHVADGKHLQRNPNVTVRMRGVMEKCTYCVQRLKSAKIKQKAITKEKSYGKEGSSIDQTVSFEDLRAPVDSVKVACQDACPSGAITFGNLLDGKKAVVNRAKESKRNYELLHYIGTRPRTTFLARVKNPNKNMPDAKTVGTATIHMH